MRALVVLALLALATPADAAWLRLVANGLEIYTDAGANTGRQALRRFEDIRQVLPVTSAGAPRLLRVFVFASAREFARFAADEGISGFYRSGLEYDAIVTHSAQGIDRVAVHEYIHYLVHQGDARLPAWLDEGLAEFYSNAAVSRGRVRVGEPLREAVALLKQRKLLPPEEMSRPPREAGGLYYAQAWALAHMLNLAPAYRDGWPRFIAALAQGRPETAAFFDAFGKSFAQAIGDLNAYVNVMRAATVDAPVVATDPPREQPLSPAEALVLRANLALETGRIDTARPLIEQAAREFPDHPGAVAGLGSLAFAAGDRAAARAYFERALQLASQDGTAWFQLALLAQSDLDGADRVREFLERAVALNPNLGEAHLLLGLRATDAGALDRAIPHLRQATRLLPRQSHVWHALAFALQKQGALREAAEAAGRALHTAMSPEQAHAAETLLESLRSSLESAL